MAFVEIKNLGKVSRTLKQWQEAIPQNALQVQIALALLMLGAVVGSQRRVVQGLLFHTPVDTGFARGNWQVTTGSPAGGTVGVLFTGEQGTPVTTTEINKALAGLQGAKPFGIIWIVNNAAYILPLNQGHSQQANPGWIELSVDNGFAILPSLKIEGKRA